MAIRKLKTQRTDARLLLEADDPVELPPAEVEESAVVLQFENVRQYVPELLDALRSDMTRVERVQVLSCLPSTRGVQVLVGDEEDFDGEEFDEFDEDEAGVDGDA